MLIFVKVWRKFVGEISDKQQENDDLLCEFLKIVTTFVATY